MVSKAIIILGFSLLLLTNISVQAQPTRQINQEEVKASLTTLTFCDNQDPLASIKQQVTDEIMRQNSVSILYQQYINSECFKAYNTVGNKDQISKDVFQIQKINNKLGFTDKKYINKDGARERKVLNYQEAFSPINGLTQIQIMFSLFIPFTELSNIAPIPFANIDSKADSLTQLKQGFAGIFSPIQTPYMFKQSGVDLDNLILVFTALAMILIIFNYFYKLKDIIHSEDEMQANVIFITKEYFFRPFFNWLIGLKLLILLLSISVNAIIPLVTLQVESNKCMRMDQAYVLPLCKKWLTDDSPCYYNITRVCSFEAKLNNKTTEQLALLYNSETDDLVGQIKPKVNDDWISNTISGVVLMISMTFTGFGWSVLISLLIIYTVYCLWAAYKEILDIIIELFFVPFYTITTNAFETYLRETKNEYLIFGIRQICFVIGIELIMSSFTSNAGGINIMVLITGFYAMMPDFANRVIRKFGVTKMDMNSIDAGRNEMSNTYGKYRRYSGAISGIRSMFRRK
jgi:hypothetical protein